MHKQLETYLKEVRTQLRSLPTEKQDQELREIRQHLQALIAGNMERGDAEDKAVAAAIRQFGSSKQVGQSLRQAIAQRPETLLRVAAAGVGVFIVNYVVSLSLMFVSFRFLHSAGGASSSGLAFSLGIAVERGIAAFVVPFLAGWMGGLLAPRRILLAVVPLYWSFALYLWTQFPMYGFYMTAGRIGLLWLPCVCLGALGSAWLTKRSSIPLIR